MCPGVEGLEGSSHGHDVIPVKTAVKYLLGRGYPQSVTDVFNNIKPAEVPYLYIGSTKEKGANRVEFGEAVVRYLNKLSKKEAVERYMCIDSKPFSSLFPDFQGDSMNPKIDDLEGSTGIKAIHQKYPEIFIPSGIMERGNFSAAAGFGFDKQKCGITATFCAFSV